MKVNNRTTNSPATNSRSKKISSILMVAVVMASILTAAVGTNIEPAEAAGYGCEWRWRATSGNNPSRSFRVSHSSPCRDLNATRATVSQHYRGEYQRSNGTWQVGSRGWTYMRGGSHSNRVLISSIRNGAKVRVTGSVRNALILVGT